jgi:hypothetical protein
VRYRISAESEVLSMAVDEEGVTKILEAVGLAVCTENFVHLIR